MRRYFLDKKEEKTCFKSAHAALSCQQLLCKNARCVQSTSWTESLVNLSKLHTPRFLVNNCYIEKRGVCTKHSFPKHVFLFRTHTPRFLVNNLLMKTFAEMSAITFPFVQVNAFASLTHLDLGCTCPLPSLAFSHHSLLSAPPPHLSKHPM